MSTDDIVRPTSAAHRNHNAAWWHLLPRSAWDQRSTHLRAPPAPLAPRMPPRVGHRSGALSPHRTARAVSAGNHLRHRAHRAWNHPASNTLTERRGFLGGEIPCCSRTRSTIVVRDLCQPTRPPWYAPTPTWFLRVGANRKGHEVWPPRPAVNSPSGTKTVAAFASTRQRGYLALWLLPTSAPPEHLGWVDTSKSKPWEPIHP